MEQREPRTYLASRGDLELKIWESNGRYPWSVTNSKTGEEIARGEVGDLESAMVSAAQAAQADWGSIRWRGDEEEDED